MTETLWGIHAGRTGDAHTLFLEKGVVALGWEKMPDLTTLAPDREAFKGHGRRLSSGRQARCDSELGGPALSLRLRDAGRRPSHLSIQD